jgi:hypothetical protein
VAGWIYTVSSYCGSSNYGQLRTLAEPASFKVGHVRAHTTPTNDTSPSRFSTLAFRAEFVSCRVWQSRMETVVACPSLFESIIRVRLASWLLLDLSCRGRYVTRRQTSTCFHVTSEVRRKTQLFVEVNIQH